MKVRCTKSGSREDKFEGDRGRTCECQKCFIGQLCRRCYSLGWRHKFVGGNLQESVGGARGFPQTSDRSEGEAK